MPYYDIIDYIKFRDYLRAAEEMRQEALAEKIRNRKQGQITSVKALARELKSIHLKLRYLQKLGKTPTEIAEETYEQTRKTMRLDKFDDFLEI